jgi:hypothetical protein
MCSHLHYTVGIYTSCSSGYKTPEIFSFYLVGWQVCFIMKPSKPLCWNLASVIVQIYSVCIFYPPIASCKREEDQTRKIFWSEHKIMPVST